MRSRMHISCMTRWDSFTPYELACLAFLMTMLLVLYTVRSDLHAENARAEALSNSDMSLLPSFCRRPSVSSRASHTISRKACSTSSSRALGGKPRRRSTLSRTMDSSRGISRRSLRSRARSHSTPSRTLDSSRGYQPQGFGQQQQQGYQPQGFTQQIPPCHCPTPSRTSDSSRATSLRSLDSRTQRRPTASSRSSGSRTTQLNLKGPTSSGNGRRTDAAPKLADQRSHITAGRFMFCIGLDGWCQDQQRIQTIPWRHQLRLLVSFFRAPCAFLDGSL